MSYGCKDNIEECDVCEINYCTSCDNTPDCKECGNRVCEDCCSECTGKCGEYICKNCTDEHTCEENLDG